MNIISIMPLYCYIYHNKKTFIIICNINIIEIIPSQISEFTLSKPFSDFLKQTVQVCTLSKPLLRSVHLVNLGK